MKKLCIILCCCLALHCANKEVQLPEGDFESPATIEDVSAAFIFYNENTAEATLNRNNLVGTTNWIINVDKRLTLEQVLPHLQTLFEKRDKKSMHSRPDAKTYLSGYNQNSAQPVFLEVTNNRYTNTSALAYYTNSGRQLNFSDKIFVSIEPNNKVTLLNDEEQLVSDYRDFHKVLFRVLQQSRVPKTIFVSYHASLPYQDFYTIKSRLDHIPFVNGQLAQNEFVYK